MADVATQTISGTTDVTYSAASSGGDTVTPGETTFLHIKNGSGASITLTITTAKTHRSTGLAIADPTVTVPAGGERFYGDLPSDPYGNSSGLVDLSWSDVTSVTFAALKT